MQHPERMFTYYLVLIFRHITYTLFSPLDRTSFFRFWQILKLKKRNLLLHWNSPGRKIHLLWKHRLAVLPGHLQVDDRYIPLLFSWISACRSNQSCMITLTLLTWACVRRAIPICTLSIHKSVILYWRAVQAVCWKGSLSIGPTSLLDWTRLNYFLRLTSCVQLHSSTKVGSCQ